MCIAGCKFRIETRNDLWISREKWFRKNRIDEMYLWFITKKRVKNIK